MALMVAMSPRLIRALTNLFADRTKDRLAGDAPYFQFTGESGLRSAAEKDVVQKQVQELSPRAFRSEEPRERSLPGSRTSSVI